VTVTELPVEVAAVSVCVKGERIRGRKGEDVREERKRDGEGEGERNEWQAEKTSQGKQHTATSRHTHTRS
jgi:hypothetical protein